MKDAQAWTERLRREAAEYRMISKLATNPVKRESFARLSEIGDRQTDELDKLITSGQLSESE